MKVSKIIIVAAVCLFSSISFAKENIYKEYNEAYQEFLQDALEELSSGEFPIRITDNARIVSGLVNGVTIAYDVNVYGELGVNEVPEKMLRLILEELIKDGACKGSYINVFPVYREFKLNIFKDPNSKKSIKKTIDVSSKDVCK